MDARVARLAALLGDANLAAAAVEAGLDSPRKIKAAKNADLDKAIGSSGRAKLRKRFPALKGK